MDDASLKTMGFEIREHKYNKIELFEKYDCFALTGFVDDIEIYSTKSTSPFSDNLALYENLSVTFKNNEYNSIRYYATKGPKGLLNNE